jgi:hypothetical protein
VLGPPRRRPSLGAAASSARKEQRLYSHWSDVPAGSIGTRSDQARPTGIGGTRHPGKLLLGSGGHGRPAVSGGFFFYCFLFPVTLPPPGLHASDSLESTTLSSPDHTELEMPYC